LKSNHQRRRKRRRERKDLEVDHELLPQVRKGRKERRKRRSYCQHIQMGRLITEGQKLLILEEERLKCFVDSMEG